MFVLLLLGLLTQAPEARGLKVRDLGCIACEKVVQELAKFGENKTAVNQTISELDRKCASAFANNTKKRDACDKLAKGLVDIVPSAYKELAQLAWDPQSLCAAAGICKVDCCLSDGPEQIHTALTRDAGQVAVMWTTRADTSTHTVEWGLSEQQLNHSSVGNSSTYTQFGWVGRLHTALITGLAPGQAVFYRVGDADGGFSGTTSFRTLPADAGSAARPLRVASIADMGYGNMSDDTVARLTELVETGSIDMVIHNGDVSYADGDMGHWDVFMRKIEPIASRVPYMVTPGNHEFWFNFTAFKHRFRMPDAGAHQGMYHAFAVGSSARFVGMNTESELDVAQMKPWQIDWIRDELSKPTADWTIGYGHRPLYCSNTGGNDVPAGNLVLRKAVESTLYTGGVDVVISGHVHTYERTWPVYNESPTATNYADPAAPVYIVNGAAGNREKNDLPPGGKSWEPAGMNLSRAVSFGVMTITPTELQWRQITSSDGSVQDTFSITKSKPGPRPPPSSVE